MPQENCSLLGTDNVRGQICQMEAIILFMYDWIYENGLKKNSVPLHQVNYSLEFMASKR